MNNIILCDSCGGKGNHMIRGDGHNPDWEYPTCSKCEGSGRVYHYTYSFTIPYRPDENTNPLVYHTNSEIHNIIRTMKKALNLNY